jgi:hypothetical protein
MGTLFSLLRTVERYVPVDLDFYGKTKHGTHGVEGCLTTRGYNKYDSQNGYIQKCIVKCRMS